MRDASRGGEFIGVLRIKTGAGSSAPIEIGTITYTEDALSYRQLQSYRDMHTYMPHSRSSNERASERTPGKQYALYATGYNWKNMAAPDGKGHESARARARFTWSCESD